jgi:putative holliday junction resolvase
MSRLIAIDFGNARIGIAISDEGKSLARPLICIPAGHHLEESARRIIAALETHHPIEAIVLGYPLLLNGKEGDMALQVKKLLECLKALTTIPLILWDERMTTAQVERTLKESNMNRKKRSQVIDTHAAAAILQNYLDYKTSCTI